MRLVHELAGYIAVIALAAVAVLHVRNWKLYGVAILFAITATFIWTVPRLILFGWPESMAAGVLIFFALPWFMFAALLLGLLLIPTLLSLQPTVPSRMLAVIGTGGVLAVLAPITWAIGRVLSDLPQIVTPFRPLFHWFAALILSPDTLVRIAAGAIAIAVVLSLSHTLGSNRAAGAFPTR